MTNLIRAYLLSMVRKSLSSDSSLTGISNLIPQKEREKEFFLIIPSFSRSPEKTKQKRGATPKAPFKGGFKRESRTTDDSRAFLVSRDTRYSLLHPCCRRPLERDSQVLGGCFYRLAQEDNPRGTVIPRTMGTSLCYAVA